MDKYAPMTQEVPIYIVSQILYDNETETYRDCVSSLLTPTQAARFIDEEYEDKACTTLNNIFVPYCTYDTNDKFPSGVIGYEAHTSGTATYSGLIGPVSLTVDEYPDTENIVFDNVMYKTKQRSIGINKDVYFVGIDEIKKDNEPTIRNRVAGPLRMTWDKDHWSAGGIGDIIYGFNIDRISKSDTSRRLMLTKTRVVSNSTSQYTLVNGSGTWQGNPDDEPKVFDVYSRESCLFGQFVIAIKVRSIDKDGVYIEEGDGEPWYMGIHIGCVP